MISPTHVRPVGVNLYYIHCLYSSILQAGDEMVQSTAEALYLHQVQPKLIVPSTSSAGYILLFVRRMKSSCLLKSQPLQAKISGFAVPAVFHFTS